MATAVEYLALPPEARAVVKTAAQTSPRLTESQVATVATLLRGAK
ncbi:hypothetical protein ACFM35_05030 [Microbacterium sp. P01]